MIAVDVGSPVPISEQLRVQIAGAVRSGRLASGARLPSVRQLAVDLDVAPRTVAKAYSALEAEGLVTTSRASGTRVANGAELDTDVRASVRLLIAGLDRRKVTLDAMLSAIRAEWEATDDHK